MPPTDLCCHASSSFSHNPLFFNHVYSEAPFSLTRSSFQQHSSFLFPSNIPSLNVLRGSSFHALGRQIKCWIHFFISFIYSFVHLTMLGGFMWSWADTHILLGRGPQGYTSEQLLLERWVFPARQTEVLVLHCVCACSSVSPQLLNSQKAMLKPLHSFIFLRNRGDFAIMIKFCSKISELHCPSVPF